MKLITRSQTAASGERLGRDHVLYWPDHLDYKHLDSFFEKYGRPGALISTAHPVLNGYDVPCYYLPDWLYRTAYELHAHGRSVEPVTRHGLNYMLNKKYLWRSMLLKLVEWYELDHSNYTWSGIGGAVDWTDWLDDLNRYLPDDLRNHVLQDVKLPARFISLSDKQQENDTVRLSEGGTNLSTWNNFLYDMFGSSVVSLITESIHRYNLCMFTEKTLFSVMGLTFPIWVVGYEQAKHWQELGFDVFDDIIDHSYQSLSSPVERCHESIRRNLHVLKDINLATQLRIKYLDRLKRNQILMLDRIEKNFYQQLNLLPGSVGKQYLTGISIREQYVNAYKPT